MFEDFLHHFENKILYVFQDLNLNQLIKWTIWIKQFIGKQKNKKQQQQTQEQEIKNNRLEMSLFTDFLFHIEKEGNVH